MLPLQTVYAAHFDVRLGSFGSVNAIGYSIIYMNVEAVGGQQNPVLIQIKSLSGANAT